MNGIEEIRLDESSFSFTDLQGKNYWSTFPVVFGALTVVGATTYLGRLRLVGRKCEFQVQFSAVTSIATVAGTDYLSLPIMAGGLSGLAVMTNKTTNVAVGVGHIDVTNSRCYLPTQVASNNVFNIAGWYEI